MPGLNIDDISERLTVAKKSPGRDTGLPRGDHDLNPEIYDPAQALISAAVLVPIVMRPAGLTLLLTQRTDHLDVHAGQISFPGGRVEGGEGLDDAALRETEEEVGLPRRHVRAMGWLDTYVTRTGFEIAPMVAAIEPPFPVNPDSFEVADVFEVPLDFFLAAGNLRQDARIFQGQQRRFFAYSYGERYIWGATAGMLVNLVEVLTDSG